MRIFKQLSGYKTQRRQAIELLDTVVTLVSGLYVFSVLCCGIQLFELVLQQGELSNYQRLGFEFSFVFFACLVPAIFCCRAILKILKLRLGKPEIVIL